MISPPQLLVLAQTYSEAVGISLSGLGKLACPGRGRNGNDKIFQRLAEGRSCTVASLEDGAAWFREHWPEGLPWPEGVPKPNGHLTGK